MVSHRCYKLSTIISSHTQKWLNYLFTWLSIEIPRKPLTFISIGITISLLFSLGLLNLYIENRFPYLTIPRNSLLWDQFINIINTFGEPPALMSLLITTENNPYNNILTPSHLNTTYDIFNILYTTNVINYEGNLYTDLCMRDYPSSPICISTTNNIYGIYFGNNATKWQNISTTLSIFNQPDSSIEYYIGDIKYNQDNTNVIIGGTVVRLTYELESNNDNSYEFQKEFDDYWKEHQNDYKNNPHSNISTIYHITDRSLDDEIMRIFTEDIIVFGSTFMGMLLYLMLLLGTFTCIGIRFWLSISIILLLICSILIGYGFACMIGADLSTIVMLVPYILIGVGVDDLLILVDTYKRTNYNLTKTLTSSGLSISLTSLCSFVAFFVASFAPNSPPSITSFCICASASFLALYIIQFLVFVPFMIYDQKRVESNGNCCCPFYKHNMKESKPDDGYYFNATWILQKTIVPIINYRICRWIIIVLFMIILSVSIYYIPTIDRETDEALMVPSDSFVLDYQSVFTSSFDARLLAEVQIIIENEDFSNVDTRNNVYNLFNDLSTHKNYISISEWLQPFEMWLSDERQMDINNISNPQFYEELQSFINITEYKSWDREIIYGYNEQTNEYYIETTRFYLFAFKDENIVSQYDDYLDYNNMMKHNSVNGYMFEDDYGFAYLSDIIVELTIENMLYCAFGVLLVLILFMDIRIALFCFIIVGMIDAWFIGWMIALNVSLDPITYACLVMAVGLTIDYMIHITHAISNAKPKNKNDFSERLSIAMTEMGGSVFKGALTTLLGGFPLIFSTSKGFTVFYAMVAGIVMCAVLHGMILVPALLAEFPCIYQKSDIWLQQNQSKLDNDELLKNNNTTANEYSYTKDKEIQMMSDGESGYGSI
eukprot:362852_1